MVCGHIVLPPGIYSWFCTGTKCSFTNKCKVVIVTKRPLCLEGCHRIFWLREFEKTPLRHRELKEKYPAKQREQHDLCWASVLQEPTQARSR